MHDFWADVCVLLGQYCCWSFKIWLVSCCCCVGCKADCLTDSWQLIVVACRLQRCFVQVLLFCFTLSISSPQVHLTKINFPRNFLYQLLNRMRLNKDVWKLKYISVALKTKEFNSNQKPSNLFRTMPTEKNQAIFHCDFLTSELTSEKRRWGKISSK